MARRHRCGAHGPAQCQPDRSCWGVNVDRVKISESSTDAAFLEIQLVDEAGELHRGTDRQVTVTVEGPGTLQGLASDDQKSAEVFTDTSCTTFEPRALAVLRPTRAGSISVTVAADGCSSQKIESVAVGDPIPAYAEKG